MLERLARRRPECTLYALSASEHVLQLYAGFYALAAAGAIRLRQRFGEGALLARLGAPAPHPRFLSSDLPGLFVDVAGALVFFDQRDPGASWGELAPRVSLYAKRSCAAAAGRRLVPLGLNYAVYPERLGLAELARVFARLERTPLAAKRLLVAAARLHPALGRSLGAPTVSALSSPPQPDLEPRVAFFARTWDPSEIDADEDLQALNDSRAECIRELRRRFGARFSGGFAPSPLARRRYPDCLAQAGVSTRRRDYLRRVRSFPVCVATTGLSGSIGWKFAEYVALSRAIVAEPLRFRVPGPLAAGTHYLEFRSAAQCADQVEALFDDRDRRARMMEANRAYYLEYGSPEAIVARVLEQAL